MEKTRITHQNCSHYHMFTEGKKDLSITLEIIQDSNGEKLNRIICDNYIEMVGRKAGCKLHIGEAKIPDCIYRELKRL